MLVPLPWSRAGAAATLISVMCLSIFGSAVTASAGEYVPSVRDTLTFDRSYAAQTEAFPEAVTVGPGGAVFYTHSDYNRPVGLDPDESNYVIGVSTLDTEIFRKGATDYSEFYWPGGLDFAADGSLIVADSENHRIVSIDLATGGENFSVGGFGTTPTPWKFSSPGGVTVGPDGSIWVSDTYNDRIQRLSSTGQYLGEFSVGIGSLPDDIETDSLGNLWVALQGENRIAKYSPSGELLLSITDWMRTDLNGTPLGLDAFWGPRGLAVDPWGALYVADTENGRIVRFSSDGAWLGTFNPSGMIENVSDIDIDAFGNIYASDCTADSIFKFSMVAAATDDVPPVTTSNVTEPWTTTSPFMLTLASTDASSQIQSTWYSTDGTVPSLPYSVPVTVTAEGTTTVKFNSVDQAQNFEAVNTATLRIDSVAPESAIQAESYVYGYDADVSLSASDFTSGVKRITYIVDSVSTQIYAAPFKVFGPGNHTVEFYATDEAGNVEAIHSFPIYIEAPDIYPPNTTSNIPAGWIHQDMDIELATSDPSGIAGTFVSTDGTTPTAPYASPIPVTSEGTTTVKYFSVDGKGNIEPTKTDQLRIDKTNPESLSDAKATYVGSATISITASDSISGVLAMTYQIDGGAWQQGFTAQIDSWGNHTLQWYATDFAGNQEPIRSADFVIYQPDSEPPVTGDNIPSGWMRGPFRIEFVANDNISGVDATYYSTDGSIPTQVYGGPFWFNEEGEHAVQFYSEDLQGNNEIIKTRILQLDNTPPVTTHNGQATYVGQATIKLETTDNLSTIAGLWYKLDADPWVKIISGQTMSTMLVGAHTLEYYSVDAAGNVEPSRTTTFSVSSPDMTPPITTITVPSGWVSGMATVMLQATDASSAVAGIWYSTDGLAPSTLYTGPFSVSAEGTTTILYRSADVWGNTETTQTSIARVDNTAPSTSDDAVTSYVDQADVNFDPIDPLSGVATTWYRIDDGAWTTGVKATVTGYYYHTLQYYSVDAAGNTEGVKQVVFYIRRSDKTFEQSSSSILYRGAWASANGSSVMRSTDPAGAAWFYTQASRIRINSYTAADAGIARVSIDGGAWIDVDLYSSNTFSNRTVWDSGDITYDYHLVKFAYSDTKNPLSSGTAINLDKIIVEGNLFDVPDSAAPVTTSNITGAWQNGPVTVTLAATDATTGVEATYYSKDGTTPAVLYAAPVSVTNEGVTEFKYFSADRRGNQEVVNSQTIRIDNTAPITSSNALSSYLSTGTIILTPADPYSGVATTKWRVDGGVWTTGTVASVPNVLGEHDLDWYSVDSVGNVETVKSVSVAIVSRYDNLDSRVIYEGAWTSSAHTSRYLSAWLTASSANQTAYVLFDGTRVDLLGSLAPDLGIARITIDGGTPQLVDLYSINSKHQQRIFTKGGLADSKHVLVLEWTGTRNAASSGTTIGLDAIDIAGTLLADTTAPLSTTSATGVWRSTTELVTLDATDSDTYVGSIHFRVNGGAITTYTAPVSVSAEGINVVEYFSTDGAGNQEVTKTVDVRIDQTAPVVNDDSPDGWVNGPVNVQLVSNDAASGVDSVLYSIDGSAPSIAYTDGIQVSTEGTTTVKYLASDAVGNASTVKSVEVHIDDSAPFTTDDAPAGWSSAPVSVVLNSSDTFSGVSTVNYSLDGAPEVAYSGPFVVIGDGVHTIDYYAVDVVGNTEATRSTTVKIDDTSPVSTDDAPTGWVDGPVLVALTAADPTSGVNALLYSTDGSEPSLPYLGPIVIAAQGVTTIKYAAIDIKGNIEPTRITTVSIDDDAPVTSDDAPVGWVNDTVSVTLTSVDDVSGVDSTSYRINGGDVQDYTGPIVVTDEGITTLTYASVDVKGNTEADMTATVSIDKTAPVTASDAAASYLGTATITLTPTDDLSGVAQTEYRLDGGAWTVGTVVTVSDPRAHILEWRSTDTAGNIETATSMGFDVARRTEQSSPYVYFKGTWGLTTNAGLSGGDFKTSSTPGSAVYVNFNGTRLDLITSRNTSYGKARLTVDGGTPTEIDLYGSFAFKQKVWSSGTLSAGAHRLVIEYTGSKNASSTGYSIGLDAIDVVGTLTADTVAPATTATASSSWRAASETVTLSAVDVDSWVDSTVYSINGGPQLNYLAPFTVSAEGINSVEYYSIDGAGNSETPKSLNVSIDKTAPVVSYEAPAPWVHGPVTALLSAIDGASGLSSIQYSLDGSQPSVAYSNGIDISAEGTTTVKHTATDLVGNTSSVGSFAVRIDNSAPVSTDNAPQQWVKGPVSIGLSSADSHSGVASTSFSVNGSATQLYTGPVILSDDGVNSLGYTATDLVGNVETTRTALVRIDNTPPVTTSNAVPSYAGAATITLTSADGQSGVATTNYRLDGGAWVLGTNVTVPTSGGTHSLEWYSTDSAGNSESVKSTAFSTIKRFEQTDSSVYFRGPWTITTNGALSGGSFKTVDFAGSSVRFAFRGTRADWVTSRNSSYGIARVTVDGGQPSDVDLYGAFAFKQTMWSSGTLSDTTHTVQIDYTGTKNIASSGYSIGVDALDIAGVLIADIAPPTTSSDASQAWRPGSATITLSATDADGLVAGSFYRVNSGSAATYTSPLIVSAEGTTTIDYWSVDAAGNAESTQTTQVRIDRTSPTVVDNAPTTWTGGDVSLGLSATDAHSGVAQIRYSTDESTPSLVYSGPLTISSEGTTTIRYSAVDAVGNISAVKSAVIKIDRTAPSVTDNAPTAWRNTPATVVLTASDAMSGADAINYTLDSAPSTYTAPVVISTQGVHTLTYFAVDKVGNIAASRTATVNIDLASPVTSATVSSNYAATATVNMSSVDSGGSGVASTKWRIDGGSWNTGSTATLPFNGGPHLLEWYSVDAAGNSETLKSAAYSMTKRFEQNDSKVTFNGAWSAISHGSLSGGSFKTSYTPGSAFDVAFTGTQIDWITSKNTSYGKARLILDGGAPVEVDLYGSFSFLQKVWSSGPLTNGQHTLRVEYSGLKNAASSGYTVGLDALDVTGELGSRRYEESSTLIAPEGSWTTVNHGSLSGGSFQSASTSGTALNIAFTGTKLEWITSKNTSYGKARVTVDGSSTVEVDLYGQFSFQQNVWSSGQLTEGAHTVRIEYLGTKNSSSSGYSIGIDALEVTGILTQATPPAPPYVTLEDGNSKIVYDGNWSSVSNASLSGGSFRTALGDPNAAVNVAFTGTRIDWVTSRNTSYGQARLTVDGGAPVVVDLFGAFGFQQVVWSSGTLSDTSHTVRIEYLGTKNGSSSGYAVGADAFRVYGAALQAVSPLPPGTRHEETSPLLTWDGGWASNIAAAYSDGTQGVASKTGQFVNIAFNGTRMYWIGARNTNYGQARVTVDGGAPITVDAYGAYGLKQIIWQSGALADGPHTVTIEALGTKSGSSSGTWVSVDAIDVVGTLTQAAPTGPVVTRYEQDAQGVLFDGTWQSTSHPILSGGSFLSASTPTGSVDATFTGTRLDWITSTNSSYGIARVRIDGGEWTDVDLYAGFAFKQTVWTTGTLADGVHTIRIEYTGRKNASSSGYAVGVDAFDIAGALLP